jgi:ribosome-associated protein
MATHRRPASTSSSAPARKGPRKGPGKAPGKGPRQAAGRPAGKHTGKSTGKPAGKSAPRGAGKPGKPSKPARATRAPAPARAARLVPRSRELVALEKLVLASLDDMKAVNVKILDVRGLTDVADTMIVASGTSDRHVRAIAERVIEHAKAAGRRPMGTEGKQDGEWVLVDLQDVLLHVMLPRVREFYALEQLWESPGEGRRPQPPGPQGPLAGA